MLSPESRHTIPLARDFMRERGCKITDGQTVHNQNGDEVGELVTVSNPKRCLPELK